MRDSMSVIVTSLAAIHALQISVKFISYPSSCSMTSQEMAVGSRPAI
jgi:hypothetical protein